MKRPKTTRERPGRVAIALALLWLALPAAASADLGPFRLDGIAATVGGLGPGPGVDVILRSDVELRAELKLLGRGVTRRRHVPLPEDLLRATLAEILGEHLIAREAARIRSAPPLTDEVRSELRRLLDASGGVDAVRALLKARGAGMGELRELAQRRAVVAAFLRSNLEGTNVVTEAQVDAAMEAQQKAQQPGSAVLSREAMRLHLRRNALDERIAHWVRVLRSRIQMRTYAEYAPR